MASPSTSTELARQANQGIELHKKDIQQLSERIEQIELGNVREKIGILETHYAELKRHKEESEKRFERIVALETQLAELKRHKEEGEKRHWQFVYLAVGSLFTIAVQLIIASYKK